MSTFVYTFPAIDDRGDCKVAFDAPESISDGELRRAVATALDGMGYPTPDVLPDPEVRSSSTADLTRWEQ